LAWQIWGAWERAAKLLPQVGASVIVPEKNPAVPAGPHSRRFEREILRILASRLLPLSCSRTRGAPG
jgi:hypothetical protein